MATPTRLSPEMMTRMASVAVRGGSPEEAFQLFLTALQNTDVSDAAIEEAMRIGPKLLKRKAPTRSLKALAGNLEASQGLDEAFQAAKAGASGVPDNVLQAQWKTAIAQLAREQPEVAKRLKTIPIASIPKIVRGHAAGSGVPTVAAETTGGAVKAVAGAAKVGMTAGKLARNVGVGLGLGMLMPFGSRSPVSFVGQEGRARNKAIEGFAAAGATTSAEVLKSIVRQQELAARRQMTLQSYEPEMFQQMLTALATTDGPSPSVTETERRIGAAYEQPLPNRRPDKDVKFLLDQLMQEMSGTL